MRTNHPIIWPPLEVSTRGGAGPQVNKFKQVSSDDHQMPLTEDGYVRGYPYHVTFPIIHVMLLPRPLNRHLMTLPSRAN